MASSRTWRRAACSPLMSAAAAARATRSSTAPVNRTWTAPASAGQDDGPVAAEDDAAVPGGLEHVPVVLLHQLVVGLGEQRLAAAVLEDAGAAAEGAEDPAEHAVVGLLDAGGLAASIEADVNACGSHGTPSASATFGPISSAPAPYSSKSVTTGCGHQLVRPRPSRCRRPGRRRGCGGPGSPPGSRRGASRSADSST